MSKARTTPGNLRFEQAVEALEQIIDQIESGEIGLEESLGRYEQGVQLVRQCQAILDRTRAKIATLTSVPEGQFEVDAPMDDDAEVDGEVESEVDRDGFDAGDQDGRPA